jgi:hypothetical protein
MLYETGIGLDSLQPQIAAIGDMPCQFKRRFRQHPGAPQSHIDIEQYVQPKAPSPHGFIEPVGILGMIDNHHDRRILRIE